MNFSPPPPNEPYRKKPYLPPLLAPPQRVFPALSEILEDYSIIRYLLISSCECDMSPLPVEQSGESTAGIGSGGDLQRSVPTPFLTKTYQLVDDPSTDELISWNEDGTTFIVWQAAEFARDFLPKYFEHNISPASFANSTLIGEFVGI
ncbi:heat stress transcription factor B-2b [Olea europaea subsp. europaea]|uniref:Heat stress transcription factor B-2b n=1 Tax=Olea europaea subsp. europaea TaxID=158383 RepID=A0A8S0QG79_OLEEU|nr:heat stress transcription factor B-2b [Olea europaea subsp. europaea]